MRKINWMLLGALMVSSLSFAQDDTSPEEPTPVDDVIRTESTTDSTVTTNGADQEYN